MALNIAHRGYVFKIGGIFMEATGNEILENEDIARAFLGG